MGWLREFEARVCTILALISFTLAIVSLAIFTDPAFLTLFVKLKPATCEVTQFEVLHGASKCNWTSCRQSYTQTIFNCTHILVNYTLYTGNIENNTNESGTITNLTDCEKSSQLTDQSKCYEGNFTLPLFVNVLGWGYEPHVSCAKFFLDYSDANQTFRCQVNLESDFPVAIPDSAVDDDINTSIRSLFISLVPLAVCIASCGYIRLRKLFKQKPKEVLKLYVVKQNDGEPRTFYEKKLLTVERLKKKAAETPSFGPEICLNDKMEMSPVAENVPTPPTTPKPSTPSISDEDEGVTAEVTADIVVPLLASVISETESLDTPLIVNEDNSQLSYIKLPECTVQVEVNNHEQFL